MNDTRILIILLLTTWLTGCVTAAVGAVAITSVDVIHDRRTLGEYVDDNNIELNMRQYLVRTAELRRNTHISATSLNGILLLTGEAPSEELRNKIVAYGRSIENVRQVVNEVRISGKSGFMSRTNDTWITAKAKTQLARETGIDANRIKVVTEYGHVYLLGLVTRAEGNTATDAVRNIGGVQRVVKVFEYTD